MCDPAVHNDGGSHVVLEFGDTANWQAHRCVSGGEVQPACRLTRFGKVEMQEQLNNRSGCATVVCIAKYLLFIHYWYTFHDAPPPE